MLLNLTIVYTLRNDRAQGFWLPIPSKKLIAIIVRRKYATNLPFGRTTVGGQTLIWSENVRTLFRALYVGITQVSFPVS
jgi:hypothetical protein